MKYSMNATFHSMARLNRTEEPDVFNRLAVLRADRGLSRRGLADAIGVHYQTVGYLERGEYKPSLVMALRIARLFNVPVEAVFSLEPFEPMSSQLYPTTKDDVPGGSGNEQG